MKYGEKCVKKTKSPATHTKMTVSEHDAIIFVRYFIVTADLYETFSLTYWRMVMPHVTILEGIFLHEFVKTKG